MSNGGTCDILPGKLVAGAGWDEEGNGAAVHTPADCDHLRQVLGGYYACDVVVTSLRHLYEQVQQLRANVGQEHENTVNGWIVEAGGDYDVSRLCVRKCCIHFIIVNEYHSGNHT